MAFIPDEAIQDSLEISSSAWRIYCFLCMRRNHTKKYAIASIERIQAILGISRSNAYKTINSLVENGWIEITGQQYTLLKGSFDPVNRESFNESKNRDNLSQNLDNLSQKMDSSLNKDLPRFKPGVFFQPVQRPEDVNNNKTGQDSETEFVPALNGTIPECFGCRDTGVMENGTTCHCQPFLPTVANAANS